VKQVAISSGQVNARDLWRVVQQEQEPLAVSLPYGHFDPDWCRQWRPDVALRNHGRNEVVQEFV
jgi:hypothetical protein